MAAFPLSGGSYSDREIDFQGNLHRICEILLIYVVLNFCMKFGIIVN